MKWKGVWILIAVGLLVSTPSPTWAHHSLQSEFEIEKSIVLKGVITRIEWVNPHVFVYMDVKDANGKVIEWALASLPPGVLRKNGVTKQMLGLGETVSVLAYLAKDGANLAFLRTITFADGHTAQIWFGDASKTP
jgi:hypothetical protein